MYKHTHIFIFVLVSLSLHMILLSQFSLNNTTVFNKSNRFLNIELSSKSIQQITPLKHTSNKAKTPPAQKKQAFKKPIPIASKNSHEPEKASVTNSTEYKKPSDPVREALKTTKNFSQQQQLPTQNSNKSNIYLQQILASIENNKFYPASARRRDMQEMISVSFYLLKNGEIEDIEISGKYKLLQLAAKTAILDSLPFHSPPHGMSFPLKVNYSMAFKLN